MDLHNNNTCDDELLSLITNLRSTDPYIKTIFTEGGCYQFFLFIKSIRVNAKPVINLDENHIGSMVEGIVYDINGIADWEHKPLDDRLEQIVRNWSFSKQAMIQLGECPICEEPLVC